MMPASRIAAMDRRAAAVHEAGHFIIARHLGVRRNWAWIAPTDSPDPIHDRAWFGQHGCPVSELDRLSQRRRIMIAVAGFIAERCWPRALGPAEDQVCAEDALCDPTAMSATDWSAAEHEPGDPRPKLLRCCDAVEELLQPGGSLRSALARASRDLIGQGVVGAEFEMQGRA